MHDQPNQPSAPDTSSPPERYSGALRDAVIGVLANATDPMSAPEIYDRVRSLARGCGGVRATLQNLEGEGLVERSHRGMFHRTWDWDAPAGGAPAPKEGR